MTPSGSDVPPRRWTPALVLTALAYAAAGWLALRLAIPPGYASPIYPAAGIALASVLTFGPRMAFAVAMGSFVVGSLAVAQVPDAPQSLRLALPAAFGLGAALQALAAAALLRRWWPRPLTLSEPREIAAFFAAAAAAGVVAASLAVLALAGGGVLAPHDLAATWLTWWSGDTLGVVIATPIALTLIGRPRDEWAPRRLAVGLPLLLVLGLLALMIAQVARWDDQRLRESFARDAENAATLLSQRLGDALAVLQATHAVFLASDAVTEDEMRRASAAWMRGRDHLRALGWGERVTPAAPAAEDDPRPGASDEAVTIRYVEPRQRNIALLGIDALSLPADREAIARARRSAEPVASMGADPQPGGSARAVTVYRALYDGEPPSAEARIAATRGVVFAQIHLGDILDGLKSSAPHQLELCLIDRDATPAQSRLAGPPGCEQAAAAPALQHVAALPFAGRAWEVRLSRPTPPALAPRDTNAWLFSLVGLAAAALLGALLLTVTGRTRRIESAVRERTAALEAQMQKRARAQAALRESEQRFRNILNHVPIGVVYTDTDGRVRQANPRFCQLTGYTERELLAMVAHDLTHPDDVAEDRLLVQRLLRGDFPVCRRQKRYLTRGGRTVWVQSTMSLLRDAAGQPRRIVAVAEDITEHLKLQEAERARESAELANRAKSEFLSRMSHELRTPLNAMLGFAQLLELDPAHPLSQAQRPWVQQIQQAGWHLLDMINDVLDLSRIEAGTLHLHTETLDLPALLQASRSLLERDAERRGIAFSEDLVEGSHALLGDATRVKQILTNLLSNAVKYNTDRGRIHVACRAGAPGMVAITVTDTGLGMTEQQLAGLFQPFNRLGRERSVQQGTGIGLVISRRLAQLMGGSLEVRSVAGRGSSFTLTLPRALDARAADSGLGHLDSLLPDYHRRRVHYIEDNETNVEVMRGILAQRPQIDFEASVMGLDGLRAIRARPPDLILLDMHLPDIGGLELLRRLKADEATAEIPVVVVSADAMQGHIDAAAQAGAARYLTKPVGVTDLLSVLDALLAQMDTGFA